MAVKCFDLLEVIEDISSESDILTIPGARDCIKGKFATYHKLLDDKESELLAELELLEETNQPKLNHVRSDLVKLRAAIYTLDESLDTSTLKVFRDEQKSVWKSQILGFDRSVELLSHVKLNFSDIENSIRNTIKVVPFWSKAKFRTELESVLELKPNLEEDWFVVSNEWFSEFTNSINLTNPQQNDSWEFPVKIPIQTKDIEGLSQSDNTRVLHSKAWDMLLAFNGLSLGCTPVKRQSYLNETTDIIEVPIQPTKHKCTIGHNDGNDKFSFEFEIEIFPYETHENILKKLSGFSALFTKYTPVIYTFYYSNTLLCNAQYTKYTVSKAQSLSQTQYSFASRYDGKSSAHSTLHQPVQSPTSEIGTARKKLLVIIPNSLGDTLFQVLSN